MKQAYFITATGTDLGKTWLAAALAQALQGRGQAVRALKPVMSGWDAARPEEGDAGILRRKVGAGDTLDGISPWRFAAPLSPDRAAAREGRMIDFSALVAWCRGEIERTPGVLLIEGIGGVMVPLDARHTVRDWIAALGIPALLVAGSYLGSISHTLTALAALRESGLAPAAVILNESAASGVSLEDCRASLEPHLGGIALIIVRRDDPAGGGPVADLLVDLLVAPPADPVPERA